MEVSTVVSGLMEGDKALASTRGVMELSKRDGGKMTYSWESQMKCLWSRRSKLHSSQPIKATFDAYAD